MHERNDSFLVGEKCSRTSGALAQRNGWRGTRRLTKQERSIGGQLEKGGAGWTKLDEMPRGRIRRELQLLQMRPNLPKPYGSPIFRSVGIRIVADRSTTASQKI